MDLSFLDTGIYVPQSYPEVARFRQMGCFRPTPRRPIRNYVKEFICSRYGAGCPCICGFERKKPSPLDNPYCKLKKLVGGKNCMECLDYFTAQPLRHEGDYLCEEEDYQPPVEKCPKRKFFNRPTPPYDFPAQDEFFCPPPVPFDISPNLPFRVIFPQPKVDEIKLRTGVERCIQPNRFMDKDINSTFRVSYPDKFKSKTKEQIALYRTPLTLNVKRPGLPLTVKCPVEGDKVIGVNSGPLTMKATAIGYKPCRDPTRPPPNQMDKDKDKAPPRSYVDVTFPPCIRVPY